MLYSGSLLLFCFQYLSTLKDTIQYCCVLCLFPQICCCNPYQMPTFLLCFKSLILSNIDSIFCPKLCPLLSSFVSFTVQNCVLYCPVLCPLLSKIVSYPPIQPLGRVRLDRPLTLINNTYINTYIKRNYKKGATPPIPLFFF